MSLSLVSTRIALAGSAPPSCELCPTAMQVQMLGSSEMDQEVVGAKGAGGES